jgi:hypothetical protein
MCFNASPTRNSAVRRSFLFGKLKPVWRRIEDDCVCSVQRGGNETAPANSTHQQGFTTMCRCLRDALLRTSSKSSNRPHFQHDSLVFPPLTYPFLPSLPSSTNSASILGKCIYSPTERINFNSVKDLPYPCMLAGSRISPEPGQEVMTQSIGWDVHSGVCEICQVLRKEPVCELDSIR